MLQSYIPMSYEESDGYEWQETGKQKDPLDGAKREILDKLCDVYKLVLPDINSDFIRNIHLGIAPDWKKISFPIAFSFKAEKREIKIPHTLGTVVRNEFDNLEFHQHIIRATVRSSSLDTRESIEKLLPTDVEIACPTEKTRFRNEDDRLKRINAMLEELALMREWLLAEPAMPGLVVPKNLNPKNKQRVPAIEIPQYNIWPLSQSLEELAEMNMKRKAFKAVLKRVRALIRERNPATAAVARQITPQHSKFIFSWNNNVLQIHLECHSKRHSRGRKDIEHETTEKIHIPPHVVQMTLRSMQKGQYADERQEFLKMITQKLEEGPEIDNILSYPGFSRNEPEDQLTILYDITEEKIRELCDRLTQDPRSRNI